MASPTTVAIVTTSVAVCLILLLVPGSFLESDADNIEHADLAGGPAPDVTKAPVDDAIRARVDDLEYKMSTMHSIYQRTASNRDYLRNLRTNFTNFVAGQTARIHSTALSSVALPSSGQVFLGSASQPLIWMDGSSYTRAGWMDKTGNGNNARSSSGVRTALQQPGEAGVNTAFVYVCGGVKDSMEVVKGWPKGEYTFIHVTRYNGSARNRIWNNKTAAVNWLSGHHGGVAGRVHHNSWLIKTPEPAPPADNWLVVVDTPTTARVNMGQVTGEVPKGANPGGAAINAYAGKYIELSDWAAAEVLVFDGKLTADDVTGIERYLHAKYGITFFAAPKVTP